MKHYKKERNKDDRFIYSNSQKSRRQFLGAIMGLMGSTVMIIGTSFQKNSLIERPLHEADFYKPHHLAG